MKKKIILIISCVALSASIFSGCGVKVGMKPRDEKNSLNLKNIENIVNHDYGDTINKFSSDFFDNASFDFDDSMFAGFEDMYNNTKSNEKNSQGLYEENLNKSIDITGISNIKVGTACSSVTINKIDGNEFKVSASGASKYVKSTTFDSKNSTLILKENADKTSGNINNDNNHETREVVLGIPSSYKGNIEISTAVGTLTINDIDVETMNVSGGTSDISLLNPHFNKLTLKQGLGSISMELSKACGDIDVSGGMGSFDADFKEVGGNLTYKGGMGDATIKLPDNAPVKISTESGMGNVDISAKTSSDYKYTFDFKQGMGELKIK